MREGKDLGASPRRSGTRPLFLSGHPEVRAISTEAEAGTGWGGWFHGGAGPWADVGACGRWLEGRWAARQTVAVGQGSGLKAEHCVFRPVSVGLVWPVPLGHLPHSRLTQHLGSWTNSPTGRHTPPGQGLPILLPTRTTSPAPQLPNT